MQIPPVSAAKHNGAGSDLILNDCLAYLRFGRYWHFGDLTRCPSQVCKTVPNGHLSEGVQTALLTDAVEKVQNEQTDFFPCAHVETGLRYSNSV